MDASLGKTLSDMAKLIAETEEGPCLVIVWKPEGAYIGCGQVQAKDLASNLAGLALGLNKAVSSELVFTQPEKLN